MKGWEYPPPETCLSGGGRALWTHALEVHVDLILVLAPGSAAPKYLENRIFWHLSLLRG